MSDQPSDFSRNPQIVEYLNRDDARIAAELHRRAQRIVDRVVAEAMVKVRETLRKP